MVCKPSRRTDHSSDTETKSTTNRVAQRTTNKATSSTGGWSRQATLEESQAQFRMQVPDKDTMVRLQRLEAMHTTERVRGWVDEGMTVEDMGNPLTIEAFRERQAERPPEVPNNIERQNRRSVLRSEKAASEAGSAGDTGVPDPVRDVISSTGQSLDASIQRAMEDRMDDSLGDVRIHTGPQAAAACESINARAFTVGNHIAFNSGEYDPSSPEGQHVLAHELAHVRQQTGGAVSMLPQEDMELEIDPDPALEREAEETAQRVMQGGELGIQRLGQTEVHVQRSVFGSPQTGYVMGGGSSSGGPDGPGVFERVAEWMRGDGYDPEDGGVEGLDPESLSETLQTVVDDVADLKETVYGDDGIDGKAVVADGVAPALTAAGGVALATASLPAAVAGAGAAFLAGSANELYEQSVERSLKDGSPFEKELDELRSKFNALADAVGLGNLVESDTGDYPGE